MKDSVIKGFGQPFYDTLVEWKGISATAIQLATHLANHVKTFPKLPPPPPLKPDVPQVVPDPKLKQEMIVKIINLKIQSLGELSVISEVRQRMSTQAEFYPRHFAAATGNPGPPGRCAVGPGSDSCGLGSAGVC